MDARDIVKKHNKYCNDAKRLAQRIYYDLNKLGYNDNNLIDAYREMYNLSLSTYELECLTSRRLMISNNGWKLEEINHIDKSLNPFNILDNAIRRMEGDTDKKSIEDKFKRLLKSKGGGGQNMKVNFTRYKDNKYLLKMLRYIIVVLSLIAFIGTVFLGEDTFLNGFIIFTCLVLITLSVNR